MSPNSPYENVDFFFQLNLLPPYSLRSQGDNLRINAFKLEVYYLSKPKLVFSFQPCPIYLIPVAKPSINDVKQLRGVECHFRDDK